MIRKALLVATNVEKHQVATMEKATGFWFNQVSHFYNPLVQAGWNVDIVSPQGGYCPIEPSSLQSTYMTKTDWELYADKTFRHKIGNSLKASEVNADNYDVIYYAGGHGTVYDFLDNQALQNISTKIYQKGGIVSAVCHGPVGLINIKLTNGQYLIKGKKITAFSNEQQIATTLDKHVPFSLEDSLVKNGGKYERGPSWQDYTVSDQRLITGQNPKSSQSVAKLVLAHKWQ